MTNWMVADFPLRPGLIRIEDTMAEGEYLVRAELPGIDPEQHLTITVLDGVLRLQAERREEERTRTHSEFHYGLLQRSLRLPPGAEEDKITAKYDKGVLTIHVPIAAKAPAGRTVPVQS